MKNCLSVFLTGVSLALLLSHAPARVAAQGAAALAGTVTSRDEGKMEGVVVSARGEGANFTVSVVTDQQGRYSFPRTHLAPGKYAVTMRAIGYDLAKPASANVRAGRTTTANLSLAKTKNLAAQLSSAEWMMSVQGTQKEKDDFTYLTVSCNYCHTLRRVFNSKHTAETLLPAMDRMTRFWADGTAKSDDNTRGRAGLVQSPGRMKAFHDTPNWPTSEVPRPAMAAFVARNNLSAGRTTHPYELKMLPRAKGKATRVIITEYDMPTAGTVAHDMDVDSKGVVWYTDESDQLLGRFDSKTGTFTEIREPVLPSIPKDNMRGTRDVVIDRDDKVWFPTRVPGNRSPMSRYDPVTNQLTFIEDSSGFFVGVGGDGYVWAGTTRIDPKTLKVEGKYSYEGSPEIPKGANVASYGDQSYYDSKGNLWILSQGGQGGIINIDVKTRAVKYRPVPGMRARRGKVDLKTDRLYFGEYWTDKVSMYDIRADKLERWDVPKYYTPYTVSTADSKGRIYAPASGPERLLRIDPATKEIVEYQWPTELDTKKIAIDPSTDKPVVWFANKRTARISKVEPLD